MAVCETVSYFCDIFRGFGTIFRGFVTIFMVFVTNFRGFVTIFRVVSAETRKPFPSSTDTGYIWLTA